MSPFALTLGTIQRSTSVTPNEQAERYLVTLSIHATLVDKEAMEPRSLRSLTSDALAVPTSDSVDYIRG